MHTEGLLTDPLEARYVRERNLIVSRVKGPGGVDLATLKPGFRSFRTTNFDFAPGVVGFGVDTGAVDRGLHRAAGPDEMITFLFGQLFIHL
jgi:hypothetical protein